MDKETKFYTEELNQLIGGKIIGTAYDDSQSDYGDEFFGLVIEKNKSKYILWILQDDEGNGPGSFEITEMQQQE